MTNNSLPEDSSMKKTVQRQRKRDNLAANPDLALACDRSLLLLQIPPTLLSAWKVFDSGPSSTRVIILTTEPNLDFLCQSMRWCGDGTFKAAPELFTQLYTIHGMKSGYTVPCVYALLPNKRKESYVQLFRQVKSWLDVAGRQWSFESFLSDYEQGAYNAVLDVFPGIGEEGCFFHLCKRLGLMTKYLTDDDFKLLWHLFRYQMLLQTLNPWQQPSSTMNCHFSATLNQLGSASQSAAEDFPLCFHTNVLDSWNWVYQDN